MTRKSRTLSNLSKALLEMAEDMHNAGLMGGDTYRTINARLLADHARRLAARRLDARSGSRPTGNEGVIHQSRRQHCQRPIGRASGRERVCPNGLLSLVSESSKQKRIKTK